jgi:uncharacterized protein (DUF885 family)
MTTQNPTLLRRCARACACLLFVLTPASVSMADAAKADAAKADSAWQEHVERFVEAHFQANPVSAVYAGRHEFDGRLPDLSAAGIERNAKRLEEARAKTAAFEPAQLSEPNLREREYLLAALADELFWLRDADWPSRNPSWYLDLVDPEIYLSRPYAPLETRLRAYLDYARAIPAATQQIRANLRTPMPAPWVEYGVNAFGGFAQFFANDVAQVFAEVEDDALQSQLELANAEASKAMQALADWFVAQRPTATQDYALGATLFAKMLEATEQVSVPIARLREIGEADLGRNLAALRKACATYAAGATLRECADKANAHKPEGGAVAGARRQLPELKQFVVQKNLATIPGTEQALVEEAPPYNAQNFAYIQVPGPYETSAVPAVYYIAPPDPRWTPEEQAQYVSGEGTLLSTSVHEVWPGHFLHYMHVNRHPSKIAQLFQSYAYTEGWAHYTEEMMADEGLRAGDPEWHIGLRLSALKRNARYLCAIGLHTGGMSVAQCEKLFRESALSDPGNARQQALRGTYDPAYLNYTLGKLMILQLRKDWRAAHPKATLRDFHDQFLSYSGPVPLVRRLMLGTNSPPL